jgi:hypothetical protein
MPFKDLPKIFRLGTLILQSFNNFLVGVDMERDL